MKGLPMMLLAGVALAAVTLPPPSGQDLLRLQQEVNSLKFQLKYETDRLERRLEGIERQARQAELRTPAPLVAAPQRAPVPPPGDELTVRRLVVTDALGNARGVLAVSDVYGPMLGLLNVHGDVVGLLAAPDSGARLELFDGAAVPRVLLGLDGEAALELRGSDGVLKARLPQAPQGR